MYQISPEFSQRRLPRLMCEIILISYAVKAFFSSFPRQGAFRKYQSNSHAAILQSAIRIFLWPLIFDTVSCLSRHKQIKALFGDTVWEGSVLIFTQPDPATQAIEEKKKLPSWLVLFMPDALIEVHYVGKSHCCVTISRSIWYTEMKPCWLPFKERRWKLILEWAFQSVDIYWQ